LSKGKGNVLNRETCWLRLRDLTSSTLDCHKAARRRAKKAREEAKAARAIQQRTQQGDGPMQEATQEMMNTHQPSGIQSSHPPLAEVASSAVSVQSHGLGISGPGSQRFEDMLNRIWEK
jgi:hypothetical protein